MAWSLQYGRMQIDIIPVGIVDFYWMTKNTDHEQVS